MVTGFHIGERQRLIHLGRARMFGVERLKAIDGSVNVTCIEELRCLRKPAFKGVFGLAGAAGGKD